jgi:hypothetical protein
MKVIDGVSEETKKEIIERFISDVGRMSIMVFSGLNLKTHIDGMVIDEDTKEEYVITVNKVSNGVLFKDGGIVFTRKQKNEFAVGFAEWLLWQDITSRGKGSFVCADGSLKTTSELLVVYEIKLAKTKLKSNDTI